MIMAGITLPQDASHILPLQALRHYIINKSINNK
jgi:hypothetical protein